MVNKHELEGIHGEHKKFVIESQKHGFFVGWDSNRNVEWVPKFRWSIGASDPDVRHFYSKEAAEEELVKIVKAKPYFKPYLKEWPGNSVFIGRKR